MADSTDKSELTHEERSARDLHEILNWLRFFGILTILSLVVGFFWFLAQF